MAVTKFQEGKQYKLKGLKNLQGTGLQVGDKGTYVRNYNTTQVTIDFPNFGQYNVYKTELVLLEETAEEISENISKLEAEITIEKSKLAWMKATKNTVYNEDEHKVWAVLKELDSKSTTEQKAKVIAKLINS